VSVSARERRCGAAMGVSDAMQCGQSLYHRSGSESDLKEEILHCTKYVTILGGPWGDGPL